MIVHEYELTVYTILLSFPIYNAFYPSPAKIPLKQFWNSVQLNKIFSKRQRTAFSYDILNTHHSHHHNHQHSFKLSLISNLLKCSSQRIVGVFYPFDGQQVRGQSETKQIKASTALTSYVSFSSEVPYESWFIMIHHYSSCFSACFYQTPRNVENIFSFLL